MSRSENLRTGAQDEDRRIAAIKRDASGMFSTGYRADERRFRWLEREAARRGWSVQQVVDFAVALLQQISRGASVQPRARR